MTGPEQQPPPEPSHPAGRADAAHPEDPTGPTRPTGPAETAAEAPRPLRLCDVRPVAASDPSAAGAVWKLAESGRQLDANLVRLPPHERVEAHAEPDLDVLLLVVAGHGTLSAPGRTEQLGDGALFWLPHGSTRGLAAGEDGLSYLTVHRRRPGMQIRSRQD
jgi:quercetin dioxygenase-like cupin family protein